MGKEIKIEYGGRSYGKAAIQELVERVDVLTRDNEALMAEGISLKRQIGGLKTSNGNYKKQVEELKKNVEHYKALDREGDELYEKKITECESLKKELDMANFTNDELRGQIASYDNQILDYNDRISGLKQEIEDLRAIIEHERKPWWKKLF